MRTFTINGHVYRSVPITFNTMADLEDYGITVSNMRDKMMSTLRAYFALCCGGDREYAGNELGAHLAAGGNLNGLSEAMAAEMNDSDFFRSLGTNASAEDGENQEEPAEEVTAKPKRTKK